MVQIDFADYQRLIPQIDYFPENYVTKTQLAQWKINCMPCASGKYLLPHCSTSLEYASENVCLACPSEGAECPGGTDITNKEGFWFCESDCMVKPFECPEGFCGAKQTCSEGRARYSSNPLCGACLPGYFIVGEKCVNQCNSNRTESGNFAALILISSIYVLFLLYLCYSDTGTPKKDILMY